MDEDSPRDGLVLAVMQPQGPGWGIPKEEANEHHSVE